MKRLSKYKNRAINTIKIKYGDEQINFNIFEELKISEVIINREIKEQPSYYAFLLLVQKHLLTRFEKLKQKRKQIYGRLYLKAKERQNQGRPYNDEMCKAWVESHKAYVRVTDDCIEARDHADKVYAVVEGFRQRGNLLQTLSSNNRKDK